MFDLDIHNGWENKMFLVIFRSRMVSKVIKFIYSEKAKKVCEISTVDLSYVVPVKSMVEISQNFVAFSEYMNFKRPQQIYHKIFCMK